MNTMKAAVIREPGGAEVLKLESLPIPMPRSGEVLIRAKAFGLNRSELFTRQGRSPGVRFPRVLGIEAFGVVEAAPGNEFRKGEIVATAMGGMGRDFDGGYAEYTPAAVNLTSYAGDVEDFMATPLADLAERIAADTLRVSIGRTFHLDDIAEAHRLHGRE